MGLVAALAVAAVACSKNSSESSSPTSSSAAPSAGDLAVQAYAYTYPLVSVEVTRRQSPNYPAPDPSIGAAPMNQLAPLHFLPDAKFTGVVRPNVDTLYTSMFFDVSQEPFVVSVPDMGGRYHLFQRHCHPGQDDRGPAQRGRYRLHPADQYRSAPGLAQGSGSRQVHPQPDPATVLGSVLREPVARPDPPRRQCAARSVGVDRLDPGQETRPGRAAGDRARPVGTGMAEGVVADRGRHGQERGQWLEDRTQRGR
ncbi:DUF1254 domain-containing protein [Nocardia yunnanensis]|uniref:DUF1254 domain-containing protein n=1 Tax=Nocardia yunnanensis TaxID=2382165 RepID=A0A386ZNZ6_9NOCA|nr:DUF1254 domain-containing protein [Nocardia yunnanensis]